ncbi:HAD family hydrolase [Pelodictyon phaeoclathratiforme]|jgi:phosphoglycolate phosphatase-like HAD superfamily hydrolase|uniref:phosphoglycolate phosphatase n=1 Tax=Pelodictyon phaeoclathratiforme (strain DSM 5477 / BU-1) TaxID=324925 RepID=B4SCZ8_PELPB|nr:HAD family hydrolase [Pelodictyon phaeoclathratiforme]ACF42832.1 Haloacid dehalogenase domain protein hydrolase [Pelodictyon phaeoclathratiforme BU-1]MBV5327972.1 HAD hydrolase-like protein [Chlorobium sp.]
MLKKLVLFDIDGTLLSVNKINRSVLVDALTEVYGTAGSAGTHNFAGKMDSTIFYEVLRNAGLSEGDIAAKFELAKKTYIEMFRAHAKPSDVLLMEGIRELLEELSGHSDVMLALLTGNFEASGRHKLLLPEINHYFPFGAFADDAPSRNELPAIAVEKAYQLSGIKFFNHDIIIIGDTEHDIACARVLNAKSIAVATGTYSMEDLKQHHPHVLYENLGRTAVVLDEILQSSIN